MRPNSLSLQRLVGGVKRQRRGPSGRRRAAGARGAGRRTARGFGPGGERRPRRCTSGRTRVPRCLPVARERGSSGAATGFPWRWRGGPSSIYRQTRERRPCASGGGARLAAADLRFATRRGLSSTTLGNPGLFCLARRGGFQNIARGGWSWLTRRAWPFVRWGIFQRLACSVRSSLAMPHRAALRTSACSSGPLGRG